MRMADHSPIEELTMFPLDLSDEGPNTMTVQSQRPKRKNDAEDRHEEQTEESSRGDSMSSWSTSAPITMPGSVQNGKTTNHKNRSPPANFNFFKLSPSPQPLRPP